jgi:GT2 family glycosyltransferase
MPPVTPGVVRLIVLNYNGGPFVLRCLEHLHALDWPADQLDLVLVDNASTDGSADAVAARFPRVRVIRNGRNTGFPANNLALTDLDGVRYVGLVNSDAFVAPDFVRTLVGALDADPGLGAVSPRMVFAPRFVDVTLDAPADDGAPGDPRKLALRVSGVRVDGRDAGADIHVGEGGWGIEHDASGPFRWTAGHAVLRVPVDDGLGARRGGPQVGGGPDDEATVSVELRLAAAGARTATLTGGGPAVVAEVDHTPRWFALTVTGKPYDVVQNAGSMIFVDGAGADRGFLERDGGQFDQATEVFAWCGGAVLLRPAYVAHTGCFDERFFLYYEDTDWSWRGRARGWRYRYVPEAVVRHLHAASSGEGSEVFAYHVERNRLLMLVKNAPAGLAAGQVLRYVLITASYARRDIVRRLAAGHRPAVTVVRRRVTSFAGFMRLLPAMLTSRRELRRRQVVPDAELLSWLVPREDA